MQAVHEGYAVEFLPDAAGSLPYKNSAGSATAKEIHDITTIVMQSMFAAVLSTDEWIQSLDTGKEPERDNLFASNQRAIASRSPQLKSAGHFSEKSYHGFNGTSKISN
jgi:hypothetical protein